MSKPVVLAIMDGVGISDETKGNAFYLAKKTNLKKISENYLGAKLQAAGIAVGVPWGEVGSSEVGHANIGAGTVVYQNYPRISLAIQSGEFFKIPVWDEVVKRPAVHLFGLATNSGIHAHIDHLLALIKMLRMKKYKGNVFVHIFTDGEDAPPRSAGIFIEMVEKEMAAQKLGKIVTVTGRITAMDRQKNYDRTQKTVDAMMSGKGLTAKSPKEALEAAYKKGLEDETIEPTVIVDKNGKPVGTMNSTDAAVFFNFRPDRARQLTEAFMKIDGLFLVTMTQYQEGFPVKVAFPPQYIVDPLAKVVSDAGLKQFHIAESEKYAHTTYFLNGGREAPFPGESRAVVPSPATEGYEKMPEMAAYQITEKVLEAIESRKYDFIVLNFANGDMVGHTGNLKAATKAVEVVDNCLGKISDAILKQDGVLVITADHGNCEEMINLQTGKIDTEHSTDPVPVWIVGKNYEAKNLPPARGEAAGILADVAPTIIEIMGIKQPASMTGKSVLHSISRLVV